jgi:predicted ABC-type ATPase
MDNFVNADVIAQGLCAYQPEKAAIQAGRIMLSRIHTLANEGANFAFETTLASRSFASGLS